MTVPFQALCSVLALGFAAGAAGPAKPRTLLEIQGKLTDSAGRALDGAYLLTFELSDATEDGAPAWNESAYVNVSSGLFTARLGRLRPISKALLVSGYRLAIIPPEGSGWKASPVKPPAPVASEPPAPVPEPAKPEPPKPAAKAQPAPQGASIYLVKRGDTLKSVAAKLYGDPERWMDIYQANDDRILRGGDLVPGQKLIIPGEGGRPLR